MAERREYFVFGRDRKPIHAMPITKSEAIDMLFSGANWHIVPPSLAQPRFRLFVNGNLWPRFTAPTLAGVHKKILSRECYEDRFVMRDILTARKLLGRA